MSERSALYGISYSRHVYSRDCGCDNCVKQEIEILQRIREDKKYYSKSELDPRPVQ